MQNDIAKSTITETSTLREALTVMNEGKLSGAVLVTSNDGRLIGIATDGDLRRMLLAGATMDQPISPFVKRDFVWVRENSSRAHVMDLMRARLIEQVPIVNEAMQPVGIHLLGEMISNDPLPNAAVIMAGGKGQRLGDLTKDTPKPMLKVAGRPILERIVIHLVGSGIRKIYLSINYLGHVIENHFQDGRHFGCEIDYLREDAPLGSGGALSLLPRNQQHPVIVMNGDLVSDFSVRGLLGFHNKGGYVATMALSPYHHRVPFGCVDLNQGAITSFREKPTLSELVNAGIYVISPECLNEIPIDFFPITTIFENCMNSNRPIGGFVIDEDWSDVGLPEELEAARGNF